MAVTSVAEVGIFAIRAALARSSLCGPTSWDATNRFIQKSATRRIRATLRPRWGSDDISLLATHSETELRPARALHGFIAGSVVVEIGSTGRSGKKCWASALYRLRVDARESARCIAFRPQDPRYQKAEIEGLRPDARDHGLKRGTPHGATGDDSRKRSARRNERALRHRREDDVQGRH